MLVLLRHKGTVKFLHTMFVTRAGAKASEIVEVFKPSEMSYPPAHSSYSN